MIRKFSLVLLVIGMCFVYSGCEKEVVEPPKAVPTVCIWDEASIRMEPTRKAARVSTMALGEKLIWLGGSETDSSEGSIVYLNIKLSDGTHGWTSEKLLATDAQPGAVIKKAPVYRRPDLVTETSVVFDPLELVAVLKVAGEWMEVVGEKKIKSGWINGRSVSTKGEDVAVSLLVRKVNSEKNLEKKIERIASILNNASFSKSLFISDLEKLYEELTTPEEAEIIETEEIL